MRAAMPQAQFKIQNSGQSNSGKSTFDPFEKLRAGPSEKLGIDKRAV